MRRLLTALLAAGSLATAAPAAKPNIVFILADALDKKKNKTT